MAGFDWSGLKFAWRLHGHKDLGSGQLPFGLWVYLLLRMLGHALFLYHEQFCFPLLSTPTLVSLFSFYSTYLLKTNQSPTCGAEPLWARLRLSWLRALNSRWEAGPGFLSTTRTQAFDSGLRRICKTPAPSQHNESLISTFHNTSLQPMFYQIPIVITYLHTNIALEQDLDAPALLVFAW